jgi:hypothetical protein
MLAEALQFFQHNEFASGMIASTALAGAAYVLRSVPAKLWRAFLWCGSIQIAVRNYDETAFDAINKWVGPLCRHRYVRELVLTTSDRDEDYVEDDYRLDIGEGSHFAFYKGRPLIIQRIVHSERSMLYKQSEEVLIRFWFRNRAFVQSTIEDIKAASNKHDGVGIRHWVHEGWAAPIYKKRALETVVLPGDELERLVDHFQKFVDRRQWYAERGLPYRVSYLFKGVPGCGKSSLILALATHFKRPHRSERRNHCHRRYRRGNRCRREPRQDGRQKGQRYGAEYHAFRAAECARRDCNAGRSHLHRHHEQARNARCSVRSRRAHLSRSRLQAARTRRSAALVCPAVWA